MVTKNIYQNLHSDESNLWQKALADIEKNPQPEDIPFLLKELASPVWRKREASAHLLLKRLEESKKPLRQALATKNLDLIYWSLWVLGSSEDPDDLNHVISFLNNPDPLLRSYALRALAKVKTSERAVYLIKMLLDPDWTVRRLAFELLTSFGESILPELKVLITSERHEIPYYLSIPLYVSIGRDSVLNDLAALYAKKEFSFRYALIKSLGELGTPSAINFLLSSLKDWSWAVQNLAKEQLMKLGPNSLEYIINYYGRTATSLEKKHILDILVGKMGERSLPIISRLVAVKDPEYKLMAVDFLGKLKSDAATTLLLQVLKDEDRTVSDYAADALIRKQVLNAELLISNLNTDDTRFRFQIIKVLSSLGGISLDYILNLIDKVNKQEKLFILGVLKNVEPTPPLLEKLFSLTDNESWVIRRGAAECLMELGDKAILYIISHFSSDSENTLYWLGEVLRNNEEQTLSVLTKALHTPTFLDVVPNIVAALASLGSSAAISVISRFFSTADDFKLSNIIESFPPIVSSNTVTAILENLSDADERSATWLAQLLSKVKGERPRMTAMLGLSHQNPKIRGAVIKAVGSWSSFGSAESRSLLNQLLAETSVQNKVLVFSILARSDDKEIFELAKAFFERCETKLQLQLLSEASARASDKFKNLFSAFLSENAGKADESTKEVISKIFANLNSTDFTPLLSSLESDNINYKLASLSALTNFYDKKIAYAVMESIYTDEDNTVLRSAVTVLLPYLFDTDFRLKGVVTEFILSLSEKAVTEPAIEYMKTLENPIDRKVLVDIVQGLGGIVPQNIIDGNFDEPVILSDNHLDEVLEKRRQALKELEKYEQMIQSSHTMTLTIMFTDVKGFTEFSAKSSLSEVMSMLKQHDDLLKPIFQQHEGEVLKKIGDALMVVFKDPNKSVLAAIKAQKALKEYNSGVDDSRKLAVRISLNTGSVIRQENDVMGDPVNLASRIQNITDASEIVITDNTYEVIDPSVFNFENLGKHSFKGINREVNCYKVIW